MAELKSGRHVPEFSHLPHREIIVDNYRVLYRYRAVSDTVLIVTVVHGRRLLSEEAV